MAGRKCKCQICGKDLNTLTAYKVSEGNKNKYYCNKEEYYKNLQEDNLKKEERNSVYQKIEEIFCTTLTSIIYGEVARLNKKYSYKLMLSYLTENQQYLTKTMSKQFINSYARTKYFIAILENNLLDYEIPVETIKYAEYEISETKYKAKNKRRALSNIEEEVLANE